MLFLAILLILKLGRLVRVLDKIDAYAMYTRRFLSLHWYNIETEHKWCLTLILSLHSFVSWASLQYRPKFNFMAHVVLRLYSTHVTCRPVGFWSRSFYRQNALPIAKPMSSIQWRQNLNTCLFCYNWMMWTWWMSAAIGDITNLITRMHGKAQREGAPGPVNSWFLDFYDIYLQFCGAAGPPNKRLNSLTSRTLIPNPGRGAI